MCRKLFWLLLCFLLLTVACWQDSGWQRVQAAGILKVGLDPTYPPFELADGQPLAGLDVDLARALAADLGVTAEFVYFGYDGLYDALLTEQVDVLISALVIAPERTRDFAYSEPYFNAGDILIIADRGIRSMTDLNGRILAVELGTQGHVTALQWARQLPNLTVQPYNSADEAITAVATTAAAAALIDSVSGRLFLQAHPDAGLLWLPEPVTVEPYAIVVRRADHSLLRKINESLTRLQSAGELEVIITRWLGP